MTNYYCNPNIADHGTGRTGDDFVCGPESLYEIINLVGTTNVATVILEARSVAETVYTLDTNESVPDNIFIRIWPGAIFDGAGTLTFDNPGQIDTVSNVGNQKIFGSSITVSFTKGGGTGIFPQWWESDAGKSETDCPTALQSAIDSADGSSAGNYKAVLLVPGEYSIDSTITLKTAPLIGIGGQLNTGVRIIWDGAANDTAFEKGSSHEGNNSFVWIENIDFIAGTNKPDYWLDFSTNTGSPAADAFHRLRELQFNGTAKSCIKLERWLNAHWEHLRFDDWGEYCKATGCV